MHCVLMRALVLHAFLTQSSASSATCASTAESSGDDVVGLLQHSMVVSSPPVAASDVVPHASLAERAESGSKVRVDLFYESRCPFCLQFLNGSLRKAWADEGLQKRLKVKLHPFGNARLVPEKDVSKGYHFWHPHAEYPLIVCQHESSECFGNALQACAIDLYDQDKYVPFVVCMAGYGLGAGIELTSYACGKKHGINMTLVKQCVHSEKGRQLIMAESKLTAESHVQAVPFVKVNGVHNKQNLFLQPVCDALTGDKPTICKAKHLEPAKSKEKEKMKGGCGGSGGQHMNHSKAHHDKHDAEQNIKSAAPSSEVPAFIAMLLASVLGMTISRNS